MSESSLPPFGPAKLLFILTFFQPTRLKKALKSLYASKRRILGSTGAPALESQAVLYVREYLDAHAANLEWAARLEEKAQRLEKAGIPSESARNRARRARGEVVLELTSLRASFIEGMKKQEGTRAFDRAAKLLCPAFMPRHFSDGLSGNASTGASGGAPPPRL